ncbi:xanthine dehydrogenase family protein molybdopterin-binding subunit [Palleronia caenipelagi]|uniref:Xanthine dehydrogenase family protein molybdopterin-binding subunit n=1 Tax=Palleronia caenipelagi TaxID=2489174 RepID=A0A547Q2X0_9RHOB|nr:xanthine dehydrogenase family protein molybdopterin-binding subunit [Palleronia caenipelagi]TRD20678.1 xanthine dehydrogenase family protein molybdopterin-binding subunit [Palleronia caenipelagi]
MTTELKMDVPQPRFLDQTQQGVLGKPIPRVDGALKVTGQATYAAEWQMDDMAHGVFVGAAIPKGHFTIDRDSIAGMDGFLGLYTDNLVRNSARGTLNTNPVQPGDRVDYLGQSIALVVAETFEQARDMAAALKVSYTRDDDAVTDLSEYDDWELKVGIELGDVDAAMDAAHKSVDLEYTTKGHNSGAMELHGSIASWDGDHVTVRSSLQMLGFNRNELADSLGVPPEQVRLLSPYVGGGFGSKLGIGPDSVGAAVAARDLGRPVRVVLTRPQVFDTTIRRTETRQHIRLAANQDGRLTGISHVNWQSNLPGEGHAEPVDAATRFLYAGENRYCAHYMARRNSPATGDVRSPGEAVGMLTLEAAMDELAEALEMDPIDLRIRNIPEVHPGNGKPISSNGMASSLRQGAEAFGWDQRQPTGTRREGEWLIGMGVAAAARANLLMPSSARVTLNPDATAVVETDMTDIGTGTYTILGQIAAETLGLPTESVTVHLGDSNFPTASGSGGSWGATSSGSSVLIAARAIRKTLAERMGCEEEALTLKDGMATGGNKRSALSELIDQPISEEGKIDKGKLTKGTHQAGYGAHFAEVAVNTVTGEVRVRRMLAAMAAGRILNEQTARSQVYGGQIWGIGSALHEGLEFDTRTGHIANHTLGEYYVPVHLDVGDLDVLFIDERDDMANPMQAKGIGELGFCGAAAAVANAIYNACGVRIRDFPATPDRIFPHL